jgi:sugar phosphate isomerase/epimerase
VAANLRANFVSTFFGDHPYRDLFTSIELYRREMKSCLEAAEKHGVIVLVENEPRERDVTRNASGTLLLMEAIESPWLRLCFDPTNFYAAGEEPYPLAYRMLKSYIAYIHIKDAARYSPLLHGTKMEQHVKTHHPGGQFVYVPVGEGGVNYGSLLRQLKTDGYKGFLSLEPHTIPERLFPTYQATLATLRQWMEK